MSALSKVLRLASGEEVIFWCPGCNEPHGIKYGPGGWTWNGDVEKPTFSPSVLVRSGHYSGAGCWCKYNEENPASQTHFKCGVCHSFVRDGQIQFLGDCTHSLAGQTVPLPPWPTHEEQP